MDRVKRTAISSSKLHEDSSTASPPHLTLSHDDYEANDNLYPTTLHLGLLPCQQQFYFNEWEAGEGKSRRGGAQREGREEWSNRGDQGVKVAAAGKWVASRGWEVDVRGGEAGASC